MASKQPADITAEASAAQMVEDGLQRIPALQRLQQHHQHHLELAANAIGRLEDRDSMHVVYTEQLHTTMNSAFEKLTRESRTLMEALLTTNSIMIELHKRITLIEDNLDNHRLIVKQKRKETRKNRSLRAAARAGASAST